MTGKARLAVHGTADAAKAVATTANLLILVAVAVAVDVRATAGLIAVIAFAVLVARPFQARTRRIAMRTAAASSELAGRVAETARLAADLRIFGVGGRARDRARRQRRRHGSPGAGDPSVHQRHTGADARRHARGPR